jgi:hypothetical protein
MSRLFIVLVMSVINYNLQVFRALMLLNLYYLQNVTTMCSATAACNRKTSQIFNLHMASAKNHLLTV